MFSSRLRIPKWSWKHPGTRPCLQAQSGRIYRCKSLWLGAPVLLESSAWPSLSSSEDIIRGIVGLGWERPSKIQAESLTHVLRRDRPNLLAQSQNGSGKTGSFGLSMLAAVDVRLPKPQAVVLCPTRDLALQTADVLKRLARFSGIEVRAGAHILIPEQPAADAARHAGRRRYWRRGIRVTHSVALPRRNAAQDAKHHQARPPSRPLCSSSLRTGRGKAASTRLQQGSLSLALHPSLSTHSHSPTLPPSLPLSHPSRPRAATPAPRLTT